MRYPLFAGTLMGVLSALQAGCKMEPERPRAECNVESFPFDALDRVLKKYVNDQGRVDYQGLAQDRDDLDLFLSCVARYGPEQTPEMFPSVKDKHAYYINAYNALVLSNVLSRYPVENIDKIKINFFYETQFIVDGQTINLYDLENKIVRPVFKDPRSHFALNCGARGCPQLPREVFLGETLDEQLDRETKKFVLEERNARVEGNIVYISDIPCNFYPDDFIEYEKAQGQNPANKREAILSYFNRYRPADQQLPDPSSVKMKCIPYDWTSNDQALPE